MDASGQGSRLTGAACTGTLLKIATFTGGRFI